ncbi:MAG: alpha/beta hydrolase [Firmicutes bacterium]|nr:alpha/beta hydrolase [Bacillota bacterium]
MSRKASSRKTPGTTALLAIALAVLLAAGVPSAPARAWTTPPPPTLVDVNPSGNAGDWLIGATPPNYDPSKPVIVFVQGLHGSAQNWWGPTVYHGTNDMYAYAYNYGYRTAFVQFRDADGNAGSMWLNGSVLRGQLEAICQYFGVPKVNIVGHSKGGVDSNSAVVHYGAYPYVQNIITLGTPHRGSQLADLCYSWWSWWLAELLGQRDDGTYVMQTSYMEYFRSITDGRPEDAAIRYYTGAGTDWGPLFSAMWFGGSYLSLWDASDGVVCRYSAHGHPAATKIFTGSSFDHDDIRMGSRVWSLIEPYLRSYRTTTTGTATVTTSSVWDGTQAGDAKATGQPVPQVVVRGGPVDGSAETSFSVEPGAAGLEVLCLVGRPETRGSLVAPDGSCIALQSGTADPAGAGEVFDRALALGASLTGPAPGRWTLRLEGPAADAYLARIAIGGSVSVGPVGGLQAVYAPGEEVRFTLDIDTGSARLAGLKADGVVLFTAPGRAETKSPGGAGGKGLGPEINLAARVTFGAAADGTWQGSFRLPGKEGVYNVTLNLTGHLGDGSVFDRTVVFSVLALRPENRNAAGLRALGER